MRASRKINVTIVPKEAGQAIDEILNKIINEVLESPIDATGKAMTQLIPHTYNENYSIIQGKCFEQTSPNLCGYHAIFNTFCFLKMFNGGKCQYHIESGASFWKFKIKVEQFLLEYKRKYNKPDEWPWREKDILYGDFERTYNQVCLQKFQEFSIFRKHENFYYLNHTWEFQYQNLIGSLQSKQELNTKFAQFIAYQGEKPLVLHLMLGITTHWLTFLALKQNGVAQYWFFDSHNHLYLDFDWEEIQEFIRTKSQERTKYKKPEFTNFQKESYSMCMKDIQTSLKLIIDCLEERNTLESYVYNRQFKIFAQALEAAMCVGYDEVSIVVKQYQHNIRQFFKKSIQWNLLSAESQNLMKRVVQYSSEMRNYNAEGQYLFNLTKKSAKF